MDELEQKYLNNSLTPSELDELRKKTDSLSDAELEKQLLESWVKAQDTDFNKYDAQAELVGKQLEKKIFAHPNLRIGLKLARIAALWFVPVLLASTLYFYYQSTRMTDGDMIVSVGKGERVNLVLPDGTGVNINSESVLKYNPSHFNKDERTVEFSGEAFFEVTHNKKIPFIISTTAMKLKVLGTKFNLLSREKEDTIEVALLEGHVLLTSEISSLKQELFANEQASFSKRTGLFTVKKEKVEAATAWRKGDLVFYSIPLKEVLKTLETNYDVTFQTTGMDHLLEDTFTGTLPLNNLKEVFDILQYSYGCICKQSGKEVLLSAP